jgi:hypothetical protein
MEDRMTRALAILAVLILSGCMSAPFKAESFGPAKRFAVVSILTTEEIQAGNPNGTSLSGLIKAASSDSGFSAKADELFQKTAPLVEKAFAGQRAITLIPPSKLKSDPAYMATKGDEPVNKVAWMTQRMLVAPGYKYFGSEKALTDLAQRMKLDGVIVVHVMYNVEEKKVSALGLAAAGTHRAITRLLITALTPDGKKLWMETIEGEAKDSVGFFGDAVNFVKMQPMWVESTQAALVELAKKLGT